MRPASRSSSSSTGIRWPALIRWRGTRPSRSPAPIRTFTAAICGRRSRPAPTRVGTGCADLQRGATPRNSVSTCSMRPSSFPRNSCRVTPIGRMVLNRNPDNFFAETEQVAFCTAHIVPGLDFSNDPLLAGRIHSYVDTQISRLGGPNFHEIPINAPIAQVHNNQRDGMHRQAIPRGRVAYEPNSLGGGCPFQAGVQGFMSFPQPTRRAQGARQAGEICRALQPGDAVLEKPERRSRSSTSSAPTVSSSPKCRP